MTKLSQFNLGSYSGRTQIRACAKNRNVTFQSHLTKRRLLKNIEFHECGIKFKPSSEKKIPICAIANRCRQYTYEPPRGKTNNVVSEQV